MFLPWRGKPCRLSSRPVPEFPFVVYMISRSINKRSDPGAAARIALLIGILAFCGLAWYLFLQSEETRAIGIGIEAIAIGAFLVVILNRRKTA